MHTSRLTSRQESLDGPDISPENVLLHLTPNTQEIYQQKIADYVAQPLLTSNPEDENTQTVEIPEAHLREQVWISRHKEQVDEAISTVGFSQDQVITFLEQEFQACGIDLQSEEFERARATVTKMRDIGADELRKKHQTYTQLIQLFARQSGVTAEEVKDRRQEAIEGAARKIVASEIPPVQPHRVFSTPTTRRARREYSSWERSKQQLVEGLVLPTDSAILEDYYRSADAAFRRSLYGSRHMVLDRGFESDSTEEIDNFQRRYYEKLGGYRIAITPKEWLSKTRTSNVDWLLYSPESELAQILDELDANQEYGSRAQRKQRYQRSRRFYDEPDEFETGDEPEPETTGVNEPTTSTDQIDPEDTLSDLSREQIQAIRDIELFIDANIPKAMKIEDWQDLSKRINAVCVRAVQHIKLPGTEYTSTSQKTVGKILARMIALTHPDKADGDPEICGYISILKSLNHNSNYGK